MSAAQNQPGAVPAVSVQEADERRHSEREALLVDVREVNEYVELRADDSVLVPVSQFMARFEELPRDRPLLMICRSGARSGRATAFLLQQGFREVSNVEGGMIAWKNAGLPTRSGPLDPGEGDLPIGR